MRPTLALTLFCLATLALADDELAKVKEQELEAVRERISELKESMDRATRDRDRVTSQLQDAEVRGKAIPEQFMAEIRKANLAQDVYKDAESVEKLRRFKHIEIKDGAIILEAAGADTTPP